jgi:hypothetical protein
MTEDERYTLTAQLAARDGDCCCHCGKPLLGGGEVQIAHRVRQGRIRRLFARKVSKKRLEELVWHPTFVCLVCSRRLNECNDAVMLGQGTKQELALIDAVRSEI